MADALSRVAIHLNAVTAVVPIWVQEVINTYHSDTAVVTLLQELAVHSPNDQGYSLIDGVIMSKGKIWIGQNSASSLN
jgi:hypothetical protein